MMKRICFYCVMAFLSLVIVGCEGGLLEAFGIKGPVVEVPVVEVPVVVKTVRSFVSVRHMCDDSMLRLQFSGGNYDNVAITLCGDTTSGCTLLGINPYATKLFFIENINLDSTTLVNLIYSRNLVSNKVDIVSYFFRFLTPASCDLPVVTSTLGQ